MKAAYHFKSNSQLQTEYSRDAIFTEEIDIELSYEPCPAMYGPLLTGKKIALELVSDSDIEKEVTRQATRSRYKRN